MRERDKPKMRTCRICKGIFHATADEIIRHEKEIHPTKPEAPRKEMDVLRAVETEDE